MKQQVIDRFNAATAESDSMFEKARAAGFPTPYFLERAQGKVRQSGYLPESGYLLFDARYTNSADAVVRGIFASIESIGDAHTLVGECTPWIDPDLKRWKDVLCSLSCIAFDAGVVAACTRAPKDKPDPILKNGALSIFGDVGFTGLREKQMALVREIGGEDAVALAAEIGDCACLHLYADRLNTERVFKMPPSLREAYAINGCKAAYLAGAVFAEKLLS